MKAGATTDRARRRALAAILAAAPSLIAPASPASAGERGVFVIGSSQCQYSIMALNLANAIGARAGAEIVPVSIGSDPGWPAGEVLSPQRAQEMGIAATPVTLIFDRDSDRIIASRQGVRSPQIYARWLASALAAPLGESPAEVAPAEAEAKSRWKRGGSFDDHQ